MRILRSIFEDGGLKVGQWKRLPRCRRIVVDFVHFAKRVPSQAVTRYCQVGNMAKVRRGLKYRVGWAAIFLKAYAVMAQEHPELRQMFMRFPWMHLYEHPHQLARVAVSRNYLGNEFVFFERIVDPHKKTLSEIQCDMDSAAASDIQENPDFRLQAAVCVLPTIFRRLIWWSALNIFGSVKAGLIGTFGLTTISSVGAVSIHPPTLGNIVLTYGPVDDEGAVRVTLVYDHRVYDGQTIGEYLRALEHVLNEQIMSELVELQGLEKNDFDEMSLVSSTGPLLDSVQ